jgi:hypothetical protein
MSNSRNARQSGAKTANPAENPTTNPAVPVPVKEVSMPDPNNCPLPIRFCADCGEEANCPSKAKKTGPAPAAPTKPAQPTDPKKADKDPTAPVPPKDETGGPKPASPTSTADNMSDVIAGILSRMDKAFEGGK